MPELALAHIHPSSAVDREVDTVEIRYHNNLHQDLHFREDLDSSMGFVEPSLLVEVAEEEHSIEGVEHNRIGIGVVAAVVDKVVVVLREVADSHTADVVD